MGKASIVVVEDEPAIRRGVADALRLTGYDVVEAADGVSGLTQASAEGVDLVLLDLLLPKKDGLEVLTELRKVRPELPVIVLTARGGEDDKVKGLRRGADDYVVKPFSARELLARVEAILRRTKKSLSPPQTLRLGEATIDLRRREIRAGETRVELSETEAALLTLLATERERAVPRGELLARVWGIGTAGLETRTVDMHIARLRAKLREFDESEAIVTVRALGYMLGPALIREEI